jgi:hypothetical protein
MQLIANVNALAAQIFQIILAPRLLSEPAAGAAHGAPHMRARNDARGSVTALGGSSIVIPDSAYDDRALRSYALRVPAHRHECAPDSGMSVRFARARPHSA